MSKSEWIKTIAGCLFMIFVGYILFGMGDDETKDAGIHPVMMTKHR